MVLYHCLLKNKTAMMWNRNDVLPIGMTHAKPIRRIISTLYQIDVQFSDKIITFIMVKCTTREFKDLF